MGDISLRGKGRAIMVSGKEDNILNKLKKTDPDKELRASGKLPPLKKYATGGIADNMPAKNKKNFRPTKSGAGMTQEGVNAYRRLNPGSKLSTAVTEDRPGPKRSARRKSYCARSAGQMKMFPKAANDPNSRLRQARKRWKC